MTDWINVKDRLPEIGSNVLIFLNVGYCELAFFLENEEFQNDSGLYFINEITHWKPLPNPPEKE